ncbi:MAG: hypothetical protein AAB225_26060 [Acidobacteriota bacterium]
MTQAGSDSFHGTLTEQHWQQRWHGAEFFVKQLSYRDIAAAEAAQARHPVPELAACQLGSSTVLRAGYGLYFDTIKALNIEPDQTGFTRVTSSTVTNNYGMNWLSGGPRRGISPLIDPFPVRADGLHRWDANIQRQFRLREGMFLELRLDVLNVQNRSTFQSPVIDPNSTDFGRVVGHTGSTNRFLQIQGRIRF